MDFNETIEAQLKGRVVRKTRMVHLDFVSGAMGVWPGFGRLRTKDGREWLGLGELASVQGIAGAIGGQTPELILTISGVDADFAPKVKGEADEYVNRAVVVYDQFFDEEWGLLDEPYAAAFGLMRKLTVSREANAGGFTRTISISAESPLVGKRRAKFAYLTPQDQRNRHPGDSFADDTPGIDTRPLTFPDY